MASDFTPVFEKVLSTICPSPSQRKIFDSVSSQFISQLHKQAVHAGVILGGSGAKDTWLANIHDVDIFVVFDRAKYAEKLSDLSNILEGWLASAFKGMKVERIHGSRDYFSLFYEGIRFEVVPIIGISRAADAFNITDISPLHSVWVNSHASRLKDDIRLAKQFCKAQGVYGAESHIRAFSGYILEILVVYYGSFQKLLSAAAKWKMPVIVDVEGYYLKKTVFFELNKSKLQSPLIVVDPVDKSRNAAAALCDERFLAFISAAKKFLKKPSAAFFEYVPFDLGMLRSTHKKEVLLLIEVVPLPGKEDVVGMKVLKAQDYVAYGLAHFGVVDKGCSFDSHSKLGWVMWFALERQKLPEFYIQTGPPVDKVKFVQNFKDQHTGVYVKDGVLCAKVMHTVRDLSIVIGSLLGNSYVTSRVLKVGSVVID